MHMLWRDLCSLTGFYKVPGDHHRINARFAAETYDSSVHPLDYETAIAEAERRGVMGGSIYDSLHATLAHRRKSQAS